MNKSLLVIIAVIVVGAASVFAVSPYFTESTVDEALPTGAIMQPKMEDKDTIIIDETIMEGELVMEDPFTEELMFDDPFGPLGGTSVTNLQTITLVPGEAIEFGDATVTFMAGEGVWSGDPGAPTLSASERRNVISIVMKLEYHDNAIL